MKPKWYAIKRPDGTWIIGEPGRRCIEAWLMAEGQDTNLANIMDDCHTHRTAIGHAIRAGYRCVEVVGFKEAGE